MALFVNCSLWRKEARRIASAIGIALTLISASACDLGSASTRLSPATPTTVLSSGTASSTSTPELPDISPDSGWHSVLQLGYVSPGVATVGGTFTASKTFAIIIECEGVGAVDVEYPPQGSSTYTCETVQQRNRNQVGSDQHPIPEGSIHIIVAADAGVTWRAIVEVEN